MLLHSDPERRVYDRFLLHEQQLPRDAPGAESEWINNAAKVIDDDFQKLVYVRSRFRMLVFQMEEKNVLDEAGAFLRKYRNHSVGDSYIFARIDWNGKRILGWRITVELNAEIGDPIPISQL